MSVFPLGSNLGYGQWDGQSLNITLFSLSLKMFLTRVAENPAQLFIIQVFAKKDIFRKIIIYFLFR
jgi:hypothetical protein